MNKDLKAAAMWRPISALSGAFLTGLFVLVSPALGDTEATKACVSAAAMEAAGSNAILPQQPGALVILVRPDQPKVGRPVIAWLEGYQPGKQFVARQVSWKFNNAASMLKNSGGGSATTIYLTPGRKIISVAVTDMSGKRRKISCALDVIW